MPLKARRYVSNRKKNAVRVKIVCFCMTPHLLRTMSTEATKIYYKAAKECVDPDTGAVQLRPAMNSSRHVFAVGSTHVLDGVPEMCRHGFHATPHPAFILLNSSEFGYTVHDALLKVDLGPEAGIVHDGPGKSVSCTMTVLSRISWADALAEAGTWRKGTFSLDGDALKVVWLNGDMEWLRHGKLRQGEKEK